GGRRFGSGGTRRLRDGAATAGMLAAGAQQPAMVTGAGRQAALEFTRKAVTRHRAPPASEKQTAGTNGATYGLASFYSYDPHTASGEKFNAQELTAAHRRLPC